MDNITLSNKITRKPNGKFKLSFKKTDNIIKLRQSSYLLKYLDSVTSSKGGNSSVFLLVDPDHPNDDSKHLVIKICNKSNEEATKIYSRKFQREILALERAKKANKQFIVNQFHYGIAKWNEFNFRFLTMEKSDTDLSKFLNENTLNVDQRVLLCTNIVKAFKDLHSLEMYHRDIKHDNILIFGNECKVGDLGLVRFRADDLDFIEMEKGDRIGAFGWESPETMNKYLTEKNAMLSFNCEIDYKSDIFQLGKLFWYILQGNLPIGQISKSDFLLKDNELYDVIYWMLQHNTDKRPASIDEVEGVLKLAAAKYAIA